jgi:hypothetical protein
MDQSDFVTLKQRETIKSKKEFSLSGFCRMYDGSPLLPPGKYRVQLIYQQAVHCPMDFFLKRGRAEDLKLRQIEAFHSNIAEFTVK